MLNMHEGYLTAMVSQDTGKYSAECPTLLELES